MPSPITLSLSPVEVDEGATATVTVTAAFTGISTLTEATEVEVEVVAGTATEGTDFIAIPGSITVTIPAGASSGTASFMLTALEDGIADPPTPPRRDRDGLGHSVERVSASPLQCHADDRRRQRRGPDGDCAESQ